jgi:hypothetical protein
MIICIYIYIYIERERERERERRQLPVLPTKESPRFAPFPLCLELAIDFAKFHVSIISTGFLPFPARGLRDIIIYAALALRRCMAPINMYRRYCTHSMFDLSV